ncbi:hypothetical protein FACS1894218_2120 [Bacilli bacterium]|nr:hypothetical protein FACS1894218_2120 [Bacilli bacterium]
MESADITAKMNSFQIELKAIDTLNLVIIFNLAIGRLTYLEIAPALYSLPGFIKSTVRSLNNHKQEKKATPKKITNGTKIDINKDKTEKCNNGVGSIQ